jgi:hypothetical protein
MIMFSTVLLLGYKSGIVNAVEPIAQSGDYIPLPTLRIGDENLAPPTIHMLKTSKTTITVKWSKKNYAEKYQVQYKQSSAKKWKSKEASYKKSGVTLKNLRKNRTYKIRIRQILYLGDAPYYSKWSKIARVKTGKRTEISSISNNPVCEKALADHDRICPIRYGSRSTGSIYGIHGGNDNQAYENLISMVISLNQ